MANDAAVTSAGQAEIPVVHVPAQGDTGTPGLFASEWRALTLGCIALISMLGFEALAVTTAMPTVANALNGIAAYALAFGATLATSVVGMVLAGQQCDRFGPQRSLRQGALWFGLGLALAGLAQDMSVFVLGRALLGFGSGQLGVALYVAVGRIYPESMRPRIFAMFAAAWVVPALVGPALVSVLVEVLGWRSVFLGVLLLLPPAWWLVDPALRGLRGETGAATHTRRRLLAAVIAALSAIALHVLSQHAQPPWWTLLLLLPVLVLASMPLLPGGTLLARSGLPSVIALRGLLASAFFTVEAFLPLWLQETRAWSVLGAGVAISIGALFWSIGSQTQARQQRLPRAAVLQFGIGLVAAGLLLISACAAWSLSAHWAVAAWLASGFGIGLAFPSLSVRMLDLSPTQEQGRNSAALQLCDALATTAALALAGMGFAHLHRATPDLAFAVVFSTAAALISLAAVLAPRAWRIAAA